jgi:cellulose synthase/poly-beta-1,6-N-acetylglucosamine synthase-like glycosyltransferase/peptidoglycan/xylan/chitin deacetylase (PgdA/CDA1 family)/spore germination protein YaaH
MVDLDDSLFIFRDERGKRWPRLRLVLMIASLLFFLGTVLFVRYLIITPQLQLPAAVKQLRAHLRNGVQLHDNLTSPAAPVPLWLRFSKTKGLSPAPSPSKAPAAPKVDTAIPEVRLGFYVSWDPDSYASLVAHAGQLTHVSPEWLTLVDGEGTLKVKSDQQVLDVAKDNKIILLPLLRNLVGDTWQPEAVEGLINGPQARQDRFIARLLEHLMKAEAGGVLIDWNQIDPAYQQSLTFLLSRLADALHQQKMELWLCIPMGLELKAFDLETLASVVDRFVAVLHDENSEVDPPGPIASQPWFDGWLQTILAYGKPSQWVVAIGAYGYDWAQGQKEAHTLSFADVMTRAGRAGLHDCRSQQPVYNPHFSYMDGDAEHTVWFLDGVTFFNQVCSARRLHAGGISVSRLGTEDPAIWQVLPLARPVPVLSAALDFLRPLIPQDEVAQLGDGNFLMLEDNRTNGYREIAMDAADMLTFTYKVFPSYTTINHQGKGHPDDVAISFDDGPDPKWTPAILDILKARGVKASFFMVGERMEEHPELVERIVREGHEIGVHTYTHPNLADVSEDRARLELNATQRLIETITAHSTFLFRPPYNADSQPHSPEELVPIKIAQELGYLTVSSDIDPEDWSRPGVDAIVQRVKEQRLQGNVILLHDAGGNRSQTVAALPLIIDYLQARGDRLISLGQLLGASASSLMPPLPENHQPLQRLIGDSGFRIMHVVGELGWAFMIVATILVALRTLIVVVLAQSHRHRPVSPPAAASDNFQPPISIVMAAYNEEKVIGRTLENLLRTDYAGAIEIILIDDGSTDRTAALVAEIAAKDNRLLLLRQKNMGKARALRAGFHNAHHEIIVTLDADTLFQPDTIVYLVQSMHDERVGAVSGHVKVGNKQTLVARFQDLEYTCGFNLDRRAYQQLNCITVVPGAVSAWRRSAVMAAGGISSDTLAEDTDLTLSLHRAGYRIAYAPRAVAWTEAPENYPDLAKQRFRWAFGTLQCLWKHRDLVGNPRQKALGWFSLPSIWLFQILLVAVSPLVDGLLIFSLFFAMEFAIFLYLFAFLTMDLLMAALACWMEGESLKAAWRILPMRFLYRPLLAWVVWKSIIRAAKGALVGWGKLERSASITLKN